MQRSITKSTLAAVLALGLFAGSSAFAVTPEELKEAVAAMGYPAVNAHVEDGVVLLDGNVDYAIAKERIESEVRKLDGVVDVQNAILTDYRAFRRTRIERTCGDVPESSRTAPCRP